MAASRRGPTKQELMERAAELEIRGRSSMNKAELQAALEEAESGDAASVAPEAPSVVEAAEVVPDEPPAASDRLSEAVALGTAPSATLPEPEPEPEPEERRSGAKLSIASASFEDLRGIGMSVTQAKRFIEWREAGRLSQAGDVENVPGFSRDFKADLQKALGP